MTKSKVGKILSAATAVCVVLVGLLLIICAAHLYFTGGSNPYSPERVGDYLAWLIFPLGLTFALAVAGVIFNAVTGEKVDKNAERTNLEMLEGYYTRYSVKSFDKRTQVLVREERKKRSIIDLVASMIFSSSIVFILDYLIFIAEFSIEDLNADVMSALGVCMPIVVFAILVNLVRVYLDENSAERELEYLKASIKEHGAPEKIAKAPVKKGKLGYVNTMRIIIGCIAIAFIIMGSLNGGMEDVLAKAVKICTECIGLG